jgi:N6-adenosine-specific RNA methylase IME4
MPAGPFAAILADPPWSFRTWSGRRGTPHRTANDHYPTMGLEAMAALTVPAAADCALFMWVVDSHFDDALRLGAAWGFTFKTCAFVWVKAPTPAAVPKVGMGYWTRKQVEQCWLFTRGSPRRRSRGVEQAIWCGRGEHSAKPAEQYRRIEALVDGPYLELFARRSQPGWSAWGNEAGSRDDLIDRMAGAA